MWTENRTYGICRIRTRYEPLFICYSRRRWLLSPRFEPAYGARPLKRAIQREVETVLAKRIISGEIVPGDSLLADVVNERLVIAVKDPTAEVSSSLSTTDASL